MGPVAGTLPSINSREMEAIGGSRVDQRLHMNGRLTRYEEVHHEGEVAGGGKGERMGGEGESAAQPGSYWLGWEFFG